MRNNLKYEGTVLLNTHTFIKTSTGFSHKLKIDRNLITGNLLLKQTLPLREDRKMS